MLSRISNSSGVVFIFCNQSCKSVLDLLLPVLYYKSRDKANPDPCNAPTFPATSVSLSLSGRRRLTSVQSPKEDDGAPEEGILHGIILFSRRCSSLSPTFRSGADQHKQVTQPHGPRLYSGAALLARPPGGGSGSGNCQCKRRRRRSPRTDCKKKRLSFTRFVVAFAGIDSEPWRFLAEFRWATPARRPRTAAAAGSGASTASPSSPAPTASAPTPPTPSSSL